MGVFACVLFPVVAKRQPRSQPRCNQYVTAVNMTVKMNHRSFISIRFSSCVASARDPLSEAKATGVVGVAAKARAQVARVARVAKVANLFGDSLWTLPRIQISLDGAGKRSPHFWPRTSSSRCLASYPIAIEIHYGTWRPSSDAVGSRWPRV